MNQTIVVAAIVAVCSSTIAPLLLTTITSRQRRLDKREDWRRQDEVADRLLRANNGVADKLLKANSNTNNKLDNIKTLVDGKMTAAMRNELYALKLSVAMMNKFIQVDKDKGVEPSQEDVTLVEATKIKIHELEETIGDRDALEKRMTE